MDDFDLIAKWLGEENVDVKIRHMFSSDTFELRINFEIVDLSHLDFFRDPINLCRDAIKIIDNEFDDFKNPVAGKVVTNQGSILFQLFPGRYGFSATLSSLSSENCSWRVDGDSGFYEQLIKILSPGWHDAIETRFTKFELLRDKFKMRAQDTLKDVRNIRMGLLEEQSDGPRNAGGHMSDHYEWYKNGIGACDLIIEKYGR